MVGNTLIQLPAKFISYCIVTPCILLAIFTMQISAQVSGKVPISGIYPSLATFNNEGECGTGAVVDWAGKLWVISYGPHMPFGSTDKLYEISSDLQQIIRPESIGGTPANRMVHKESNQLFIGPYVIDAKGNVRVIPIKVAPGRFTGTARSLSDPANKVIIATMEQGFYEVDVHSLAVKTLYKDGNQMKKEGAESYESDLLLGVHGKGLYSGQGVLVFSNNGEQGERALIDPSIEAGSLSEWDGKKWKLIRRNQFTEVTGPGGIYGNEHPATDPIWATGWDYKSVIVALRDNGIWSFHRLPKASNSYDGAHGWNTEWPRIRNVGTNKKSDYLMTMHGMFWQFPQTFSAGNTAGIRPRSAYLKVIGDYTRLNDQLVFGCDDAAKSEFLNTRNAKGGIAGPGLSQSNVWFTAINQPDHTGTKDASGSVWLNETIAAGAVSEPFLFAGWVNRIAWIKNEGATVVNFTFEINKAGNNKWSRLKTISVQPNGTALVKFTAIETGEWIRVKGDKECKATVSFVYSDEEKRNSTPDPIFNGLANVTTQQSVGGLLYSLGDNRRSLGILANRSATGNSTETGYYEMDEKMNIVAKMDTGTSSFIRNKVGIPNQVVTVDAGSFLITDDSKRHWRLPLGNEKYQLLMKQQSLRICREVATERDLFSCGGTFYELPAENAGGYAKIKPISSHNLRVNDYTAYRGLLVMTGVEANAANGPHIYTSADNKCTLWAGAIDDLWKLGKPVGKGGPWVNSQVEAGIPSDPYLFGSYDSRKLTISHQSNKPVQFRIEMDPTGDQRWMNYQTITVQPKEKYSITFPKPLEARWIRFVAEENATVTTWLEYQ